MIRHFFLDKTNTIFEDSKENLGLNPISTIRYGKKIARTILHFDIKQIEDLINDKTICDLTKLSFNLKMTNCFSLDDASYRNDIPQNELLYGKRATSFDLMLFKLPCEFDEGRGYDYNGDFWIGRNVNKSTEGSTWYQSKNIVPWTINDKDYIVLNEKDFPGGIFSLERLENEYENYLNNKESIIINTQHFDNGCESLNMDITKYVMDVLNGEKNYGLCLAFTPNFERKVTDYPFSVTFFNDHTNTFFHPYVEMNYSEIIKDNRDNFIKGLNNRLYLYVSDDGININLDKLPTCIINNINCEVKQATKGVYYAIIDANALQLEEDIIYTDKWSEIALNGQKIDDVEMEFVVNPISKKINIGNSSESIDVVPSIYGINDNENIIQEEIREVNIDFREKFTTNKKHNITSAEYRIYVKDGEREIDVIKYSPIEKTFLNNYFIIYGQDLIPNKYYVDIKYNIGRNVKYAKNILQFNVVSDVTERYV
jgi:hypothetical protein